MSEAPPVNHNHNHSTTYLETYVGVVAGDFVRRDAESGPGLRIEGTCPRCQGGTVSEYPYGLAGTGTKGIFSRRGAAPAPVSVPVSGEETALLREVHFCECGHPHPDLPADAPFVGCGASWRVAALSGGAGGG
ncbi:hypothetical protein SAMN04487983_100841 [Streptomyces sp. yr375]|uniref:hypothetical protein n=1 Tax=Streptomyces sp. yr375 TaxID=1761906 RepID=UPI0008C827A7|nr:hypothetical protein [Streptomyces sp. yr375]SEQ78593.1 hypothetical protein SAMN04487983_100841 [Streptomyces sp. yr375]